MSTVQLLIFAAIGIGFATTCAAIAVLAYLIVLDLRDRGVSAPLPPYAPSEPMAPLQGIAATTPRQGPADSTVTRRFNVVESTIPPLVSLDDWRRGRMP